MHDNKMISKDLLSIVLGEHIETYDCFGDIDHCDKKGNLTYKDHIRYWNTNGDRSKIINMYALANKCKIWAKDKGYFLQSGYDPNGIIFCCYCSNKQTLNTYDSSEAIAIFKFCQYILEK